MDNFFHYLSTHPLAAIIVAVIILFMVYFVIKKLLKLALILGLILIAVSGYFYYKAPDDFPKNVRNTINKARKQTGEMAEKSKEIVGVGMEMLKKGKDLAVSVEKVVEKKKKEIEEE